MAMLSIGGDTMYLITKQLNQYANRLVISAHGGIAKKNSPTFMIEQASTLQFYSVHGEVTSDYGLRNFVHGGKAAQKTDLLRQNEECYDYSLSKYQGKHGNVDETYATIEENIDYLAKFNEMLLAAGDRAPPGVHMAVDFDVVTIRNRWFSKNVTLKTVLTEVAKIHHYPEIHCYFCRSFM